MGLDRPHATEAVFQHHQTGPDLEPTGEEEEREVKETPGDATPNLNTGSAHSQKERAVLGNARGIGVRVQMSSTDPQI